MNANFKDGYIFLTAKEKEAIASLSHAILQTTKPDPDPGGYLLALQTGYLKIDGAGHASIISINQKLSING